MIMFYIQGMDEKLNDVPTTVKPKKRKAFYLVIGIASALLIIIEGYALNLPYMWPIINLSMRSEFEEFKEYDNLYLVPEPELLSPKFNIESIIYTEQQTYKSDEFNFKFKTPWKLMEVENLSDAIRSFVFEGGNKITVLHSESSPINELKIGDDPNTLKFVKDMRGMLGEKAYTSDYVFTENVLSVTPNNFKIFGNPQTNVIYWVLLVVKMAEVGDEGKIYKFENPTRGFQFGDPNEVPGSVKVIVFPDEKNRILFSFGDNNITQNQINFILSTIEIN